MLEHVLNGILELLLVLFRMVGKNVARGAAPDQLLVARNENVNYQRSDRSIFHRGEPGSSLSRPTRHRVMLDAVGPQRLAGLNLEPGMGMELAEVGGMTISQS